MINKIVAILFFGLMTINLHSQSQVENMLRDAKSYNKAYLDNDFEAFTALIIPSIVSLAGGTEIMAKIAKEQYELMISTGLRFDLISPKKPSKIMLGGDDLHAILPQRVVTNIDKVKYEQIAYYLASSNDEGKTWTFADLEPYDSESIKIFVPSFTGDLEIPVVEYAKEINK